MKTISATLKALFESELCKPAVCWIITRQDGTQYFFTDHDTDLIIDGDTYEAASGILPLALSQNDQLSVDNMDVIAFLSSTNVTEADLLAGLFNYAVVDVFVVDRDNINADGGETTTGTFGTETYSIFAQQTELVESKEFGHFDGALIISGWNANLPACTITKLWARLRWQGTGDAPIKIGIYDASDSDETQWTVEQVTPETLIASNPTSGWRSIVVDWDLAAGEKALAIIAYNVPADTYGLRVFYDFSGGTPDDGSVVRAAAQALNDPLGSLGAANPSNWCLYAEYSYTVALTDKLWLARGWTLGRIEIRDQQFQAEIRGKGQHLMQQMIEVYSPSCRASLGDSRCGIDLDDSAETYLHLGTVTSVTSDRKKFIDTSVASGTEDGLYTGGLLTWLEPESGESYNGENADYEMEIKLYDSDTNEFELFQPMPNDIAVGDEFIVTWGCNKSFDHCKDRFNNVDNFRGEPFIPGWDKMVRVNRP